MFNQPIASTSNTYITSHLSSDKDVKYTKKWKRTTEYGFFILNIKIISFEILKCIEQQVIFMNPEAVRSKDTLLDQLHQAREATEWKKKYMTGARNWIQQWTDEISIGDLEKAIQKLKKGESCGLDNIPNDALIKANKRMRKVYRQI